MRMFLLTAMFVPTLSVAQPPMSFSPSMNEPNYSTFVTLPSVPNVWRESSRLRQLKLEAALALKSESATLLESDGGTFTRQHEAYIRRRARAILSWSE